jgi:YesN/AraC family two-component response regulator
MPNVDALDLFKMLAADKYQGNIIIVSGQDENTLYSAARFAAALGLNPPKTMQKPLNFQDLRAWLHALNTEQSAAAA